MMKTNTSLANVVGFITKPTAALLLGCALAVGVLAQKPDKKVISDSILGVKIGMTAEQADEALERVGANPAGEGVGESEEGETKEVWTIRGTAFSRVVLMRNKSGRVAWISGFVRPAKEIDFRDLGDLTAAARSDANQAVWNVTTADGGYRLVAKGREGKATIIYLLSLASAPIN